MSDTVKFRFKLGDQVTDPITRFRGVVTARTEWLNRCIRYAVQPREMKDGRPIEDQWFDEGQLTLIKGAENLDPHAAAAPKERTGGPTPTPRPVRALMKHVLVTGGNGFIGEYVVEELETRGYRPVIFDRHWGFQPREGTFGDIKDSTLVDDAVSHVDGVIHLAGVLGTQETVADPRPAAETNILGGLNVITACAKYDLPLVNIAVGNWWMNNTYSITKNSVERFIDMKREFEARRMASVRALNAYGPRQAPTVPYGPSRVRKIMPSFICRALSGEPIEVYGEGDQVMDMVYVTDVAKALVSALEHVERDVEFSEGTVEVGTGRPTTVMGIARMVADEVAKAGGKPPAIEKLPMRPGEPPSSVVLADTSLLHQIGMNAKNFTRLETGIQKTVEFYRGYLKDR